MRQPTAMAAPRFPIDASGDDPALAARKAALRRAALVRRAGLDPALGARVAGAVLAACPPPPGASVAAYWPMAGELDPRPLLRALARRGHAVGLPVTPRRGLPLAFRRWRPGDALVDGRFGTREPAPGAEPVVPAWLAVPLLAFDRAGRRLGYGGGYYDRTLASLPGAVAVGMAWAALEVAAVPAGPRDARLDWVATEDGAMACGPGDGAGAGRDCGGAGADGGARA